MDRETDCAFAHGLLHKSIETPTLWLCDGSTDQAKVGILWDTSPIVSQVPYCNQTDSGVSDPSLKLNVHTQQPSHSDKRQILPTGSK